MLRTSHLNGFWRGYQAGAAITPGGGPAAGQSPVVPTNAWTFDDPYAIGADSIGNPSRPLTLNGSSGGWAWPSKRGISLSQNVSTANGVVGVAGDPCSVTVWVLPSVSDDVDFIKLYSGSGEYIKVYSSQATASTFSIFVDYWDGSFTTQYELATSQPINAWYFVGIAFTGLIGAGGGAKAIKIAVNGTVTDFSGDIPDNGPDYMSFNSEATGTGNMYRDELYFWEGTALSASNLKWIYNNGLGRYVGGDSANPAWL